MVDHNKEISVIENRLIPLVKQFVTRFAAEEPLGSSPHWMSSPTLSSLRLLLISRSKIAFETVTCRDHFRPQFDVRLSCIFNTTVMF